MIGARRSLIALAAVALVLWAGAAVADPCPGWGTNRGLIPYAKEQITVDGTVKTLTAATYHGSGLNQPAAALIGVTTAAINALDTGDNPSSTVGINYAAGEKFWVCGTSVQALKVTRSSGSSGVIDVIYYRRQ